VFVMDLPASLGSAADARRRLSEEMASVPAAVAEDAQLMTTELITNAVRHGHLPEGARIQVMGYRLQDRVRVEVLHHGTPLPTGYRPREPNFDDASGWGLLLVDRFSDRWGATDGGGPARVWFEIDLS
jgi:anti-sigma regulatory factor (Ser/Thr protein kinase)